MSNLVAVVRPQRSQQRVNSSAQALGKQLQTNAAGTATAITLAPPTTTKFSKITAKRAASQEGGKANLNYKDVNGRTKGTGTSIAAIGGRGKPRESVEKGGGGEEEDGTTIIWESKQDESQIVGRRVNQQRRATKTSGGPSVTIPTPAVRKIKTPPSVLPGSASRLTEDEPNANGTTATRANDKTDQFVPGHNNNNNIQLVPAVLSSPSYNDPHGDNKKQHENGKQPTNKHLLGHTRSQPASSGVLITTGHEHPVNPKQKHSSEQASNCYSNTHRQHHAINLNLTKSSTAINPARNDSLETTRSNFSESKSISSRGNSNVSTGSSGIHAINDHILAKPMGQQVLSLMMLDAGLLPAGSSEQQQSTSLEGGHVHIQSKPPQLITDSCISDSDMLTIELGEDGDSNEMKLTLLKDSAIAVDSPSSASFVAVNQKNNLVTNSLNDSRSYFIDCTNQHEQQSQTHSIQPNLSLNHYLGHENFEQNMFSFRPIKLKPVETIGNNKCITSVSLPSSPCLSQVRSRTERHRTKSRAFHDGTNANCTIGPQDDDSTYQHRQRLISQPHDDGYRRATARWLSPIRFNDRLTRLASQQRQQQQQMIFARDNQTDSHSVTSSSCSSLSHHCPPLLTLSNQLNGIKFHELIKANDAHATEKTAKQQQRQNNSTSNDGKIEQLKVSSSIDLSPSTDQAAQIAKQHELLTSDLNCENDREILLRKKIDHSDAWPLAIGHNFCSASKLNESEQVYTENENYHYLSKDKDESQTKYPTESVAAAENISKLQLRLVYIVLLIYMLCSHCYRSCLLFSFLFTASTVESI